MIRYLVDPANAITATGLLFSSAGLYFALLGQLELAVAAVLWAMLADHLDGVVAGRTKDRSPNAAKMGKSLDGYADLVYGAVFPAVVLIQASDASLLSLLTATTLLLAGAVRLSYFSNFGRSSDGCFTGVPLSYDVPLLALLLLMRPWLPEDGFVVVLNIIFLGLAVLHVASLKVPSPNGIFYAIITVYSIGASSALAFRALS